jgi:large subunit ribosomal protein L13e
LKHNNRLRLGKGFTPSEIKGAKLSLDFAKTVGISVDKRRRNLSEEGYQRNVERLVEYKSKLILYPKRSCSDKRLAKGSKKGLIDEATKEQRKTVTQLKTTVLPAKKTVKQPELREITEDDKKKKAWRLLRDARKDQRAFAKRVQKKLNPTVEKKPQQSTQE